MSEKAAILKQLRIKSDVVKRYKKEVDLYHEEVEGLRKKTDSLVTDKAEEWNIKNAKRMTEESEKMIQDTKTRLEKALGELSDLVKRVKDNPDVVDTAELINAQEISEKAEESEKMIQDTKTRLEKALGELSDLVKRVKDNPDVVDTAELINAQEISEEAEH